MRRRPNILLIQSDQHRSDCVGVNGHRFVRTPNLDRLAAGGTNFTHAFTPSPVCSPTRASLQTGAWPTTHGCGVIPSTEGFRPAASHLPVMTRLLADAGYRVGHVGKFHGEVTGGPTDHGAEVYVPTAGYSAWRQSQGVPAQPKQMGLFGETDPSIRPEQSPLAWQCDRTLELVDAFAATTPDRPFFLRWDPPEPHLPNRVPEPYASMYPLRDIDPWPGFPDSLTNKPQAQRRTRQRWGTDGWQWDDWRPIVQRYLGEITLLDHQVGRLLDRLDDLGLARDTLVIYTTDHGDMCGSHGMIDKHYCAYDDILRVPLIVRWPGVLPAGTTSDAMVIHALDLARTIVEAAGIAAPPTFVGTGLLDPSNGRASRDAVLAQYQGTQQGLYSLRALRDRRYKYIYNPTAIDELYDLQTDPGEIANLIDDPALAAQAKRMRSRLADWMRRIGDPLCGPTFDWGRSRLPSDHPAYAAADE